MFVRGLADDVCMETTEERRAEAAWEAYQRAWDMYEAAVGEKDWAAASRYQLSIESAARRCDAVGATGL